MIRTSYVYIEQGILMILFYCSLPDTCFEYYVITCVWKSYDDAYVLIDALKTSLGELKKMYTYDINESRKPRDEKRNKDGQQLWMIEMVTKISKTHKCKNVKYILHHWHQSSLPLLQEI